MTEDLTDIDDELTVNHEGLEEAFMSNLRDYHENDD